MDYKKFELVPETEKYINILNEEGNEELCQIIFTLDSEELGKKYVVFARVSEIEKYYSDDDSDDEQIEVGAASYVEGENGQGELKEIETDEEWAMIEEALEEFDDALEEHQHEHEHKCHCHEREFCEGSECECDCECECEEEDECGCGCGCGCHHEHKEEK